MRQLMTLLVAAIAVTGTGALADEFRYERVDGINYNVFIMIRPKPSDGELNN